MSEATPRPQPPTLLERIRTSPITFALAAINVAVFVYAESHGSTTRTPDLLRFGAEERLHIAAGEYWRLVTPMFLHIGWMHLLWNTYASVGWCTAVENAIGKLRFLIVYLAAGIGGACASALFHRATSAGASGAMFGIIGATLVARYRMLGSFAAFRRDRFVRANVVNMAIWTFIGTTAIRMDNFAHGGGLVVGTAATLAATSPRARVLWSAFGVGLVALFLAAMRPGWTPRGEDAEVAAAYTLAYATGIEGFSPDLPRALRFADLTCRAPATSPCQEAALALVASGDDTAEQRGKALLARSCEAGHVEACEARTE